MSIEITNGAFVHRFYICGGRPELLAVFQYSSEAEAFAKLKIADDAAHNWFDAFYVVTCTQSARMKEFRNLKKEGAA